MIGKYLRLFLVYAFVLLAWWAYRYFTRFPEWADELIFKPLIWLTPMAIFLKYDRTN